MDFITRVYRGAGRSPKYRSVGRGILKMMGWFNPLYRELPEMLYLTETPGAAGRFQTASQVPRAAQDQLRRRHPPDARMDEQMIQSPFTLQS